MNNSVETNGAAPAPVDNNLLAPMDFGDLEPVQVPVTINGRKLILLEASGDAGTKWRNQILKCTRVVGAGKAHFTEGMADSEAYLVSLCLYYADDSGKLRYNPNGDPDPRYLVSQQKLRGWPNYVQKDLFARLKAISKLDETTTTDPARLRTEIRVRLEKLKEVGQPVGDLNELTGPRDEVDEEAAAEEEERLGN